MIDIVPNAARRAVAVHTGAHKVVKSVIVQTVRAAAADGNIFAVVVIVGEYIGQLADLPDGIAVPDRAGRLAADTHIRK